MKDRLRYAWLSYRREPLWFPLAFLLLFVVLVLILPKPGVRFSIDRAYLGFIVPLVGGILAAYGILDDPALELRFSTPVRAERWLAARLGLILGVQTVCAGAFQLFLAAWGVDLSPLGNVFQVQTAWFVPTLALASLGSSGALLAGQTSMGAFLAGAAWLVQVLMSQWMQTNARLLFLFLGVIAPQSAGLAANQLVLGAGSAALLLMSWACLRRPERYL